MTKHETDEFIGGVNALCVSMASTLEAREPKHSRDAIEGLLEHMTADLHDLIQARVKGLDAGEYLPEESTADDWHEEWGVTVPTGGAQWHYESYAEALQAADGNPQRIWTIVSGSGRNGRDCEWIHAGAHVVNRLGYLVSEKEREQTVATHYLWRDYDQD